MLYIVYCILHTVYCTMNTVYSVYCALHTVNAAPPCKIHIIANPQIHIAVTFKLMVQFQNDF